MKKFMHTFDVYLIQSTSKQTCVGNLHEDSHVQHGYNLMPLINHSIQVVPSVHTYIHICFKMDKIHVYFEMLTPNIIMVQQSRQGVIY